MGTRRFWGVRETYPCVVSGGRHPNNGTTWRTRPARPPFEVEESKAHPGFPGNVVAMSGDSLKPSALHEWGQSRPGLAGDRGGHRREGASRPGLEPPTTRQRSMHGRVSVGKGHRADETGIVFSRFTVGKSFNRGKFVKVNNLTFAVRVTGELSHSSHEQKFQT